MAHVADTTSRTLRLLSLLQRRRHWPGPELADRLEISTRTLRRDVDRLRELGYAVESDRGVEGGYRLAGTVGDTALLLDDDESIALAVALHVTAAESGELGEASLGALTKVVTMLTPERRRRVEALRSTTAVDAPMVPHRPPLAVLDVLAAACRDQVRVSFDYRAADGTASSRVAEAHGLVTVDGRWYLVAHDDDRSDWRIFRLDRITEPRASRNSYPPRRPPADDLGDHVRSRLRDRPDAIEIVLDVEVDGDEVRRRYGRWVRVDDLGHDGDAAARACRVTMRVDDFVWPTRMVVDLASPVTVVEPVEFAEHLHGLARTLAAT